MGYSTANYCPDCPRNYPPIPGDGPQPADFLLIGERPGKDENKYGRVFIGKSGQELNETYLPLAGLARPEVRVCNAVRCWADSNRTPTDKEVFACAGYHLRGELLATSPEVVVLCGSVPAKLTTTAGVKINLETHHGIPQKVKDFYGWTGYVVPMYHPAIGLREGRYMTLLLDDWGKLAERLAVKLSSPPDSGQQTTDYRLITGKQSNEIPLVSPVAVDTESHGPEPFSIQVSSSPSTAYMVLASDKRGMEAISQRIRRFDLILHNATHDLAELSRLGIRPLRVRDTMQEAFHLGNLPQGLKPLVYRLFGFTMTSWEDTVRPDSVMALLDWITEANDIAIRDLYEVKREQLKTKVKETVKHPHKAFFERVLKSSFENPEYDPWKRIDEWWAKPEHEKSVAHLEARIGRYPILGIGNCSIDRAVKYACGDADWTGRVAGELTKLRQSKEFRVAEIDYDN